MASYFAILFLLCAHAARGNVVKTDAANYDYVTKENELVLLTFTAPWCNHCVNFAPNFEAAAKALEPSGIVLARMDVDPPENKAIARSLGVKGYPALIIFKDGQKADRESAHIHRIRGADDVTNFMLQVQDPLQDCPQDPEVDDSQFTKTEPNPRAETPRTKVVSTSSPPPGTGAVQEIETESQWNRAIGQNDIVLAMFYAPWCGHCKMLKPAFAEAGSILKKNDILLVQVDATDEQLRGLATKFQVQGFPTLKVFKYGEYVEDYKGGRQSMDIVAHMQDVVGNVQNGDKCLSVNHAAENYKTCCANGAYKKGVGRQAVCKQAKKKL